ncbi:MAG: FHIPEP family type III secretion protein [Polyangiaceae bacterium]|nr:FHIPEP family type III secretion protein [Polyangiaceae bacterium]
MRQTDLSLLRPRPRRAVSTADATLAALVISVVALMIIPLPTPFLDLLLAANLAASVVILLVALSVSDALKIAAFPTLLLVTTLVRLALNVSSTRLILLQADAGEVIRAFGQFVVRGNYVVGGVVFLLLTIIQFVVIARGSERVAEVGARFTLDAMPGKQMAIDGEVRSGAIDGAEARRRRYALTRESQFYGAMDGAMKFVKGDVAASIVITLVNIVGGLVVGMGQKGLDLVTATKRYGLLTVGDGLVSQIPSLVIATAAGVLVTRVASEEADTPLGDELAAQLLGAPRALFISGLFVAGLALVPGLPAFPFLVIAGLLLAASWGQTAPRRLTRAGARTGAGATGSATERLRFLPVVTPWSLGVATELGDRTAGLSRSARARRAGIRGAGAALPERLFRELGVPLPDAGIEVVEGLPACHVLVSIHEVPAHTFRIPEEIPGEGIADYVVTAVLPILRRRAADFLGIAETQRLLDELEQVAPATVRQVVPKPVPVSLLADVLRRLVEEGISVRDQPFQGHFFRDSARSRAVDT